MDLTFAWFGLLAFGAVLFAQRAPAEPDRHTASCFATMLFGQWAVSNIAMAFAGSPWSAVIYPPMDLFAVLFITFMWLRAGERRPGRNRLWMVALGMTFMTQLGLHALYWGSLSFTDDQAYGYALALNIIFAMQLAIVSWPGVRNVGSSFAVRRGDLLSGLGLRRLSGRASSRRDQGR